MRGPSTTETYALECLATGHLFPDSPAQPLTNPQDGKQTALLRTHYEDSTPYTLRSPEEGLFRFQHFLPVRRPLPGSGCTVAWKSTAFAQRLALKQLYIAFSGWAPARGAFIPTGTFKEHEAFAVYARLGEHAHQRTLVVASAGNTARAFLRVATENELPLVVVVPEQNLADIWTPIPPGPTTVVVAVPQGMDYTDAINLAALLAKHPAFLPEGGARNVARRDGMGTSYLAGVDVMGALPAHYVQAVGSGTGAIAAWEANMRLNRTNQFAPRLTRLHLVQNKPFTLLTDAWAQRSRTLPDLSPEQARADARTILARVLANRTPPWAPVGGLFDALTATNGEMYSVTNEEASSAGAQFFTDEGIDPSPAAMVAVAGLVHAVERGNIPRDESILLNITGGGYRQIHTDFEVHQVVPDIVATENMFETGRIAEAVQHIQREKEKRLAT